MATSVSSACFPSEEPEQLGEYVEFYNDSDAQLCPGTVSYVDVYLLEAFALLGEQTPLGRFVEYHWDGGRNANSGETTSSHGRMTIEAGSPVLEHELVHAVHLKTWPRTVTFLEEGLAEVLGNTSVFQDAGTWRPVGSELDDALSGFDQAGAYQLAWLVVSQIVLEHGFTGLRTLWFELEPASTMAEVRAAYTRLFGGSFDDLTQPFAATVNGEAVETKRGVCRVHFCTGEAMTWNGERAEGTGVGSCDDADAVTPSESMATLFPWRDFVVEGVAPAVGANTAAGVYVDIEPCNVLRCDHYSVREAGLANPPREPWEREDVYRVRVQTDPDALEPGAAPTFELVPFW